MARAPRTPKVKVESPIDGDYKTLAFEYIKSQFFRVIHADGAIASISPSAGKLHIAFYSERTAIPKMTVHRHNADGTLGDEIEEETVSRSSIIREMDVDVVIDIDAVDGLIEFLQAQRSRLEQEPQVPKRKKSGGSDAKH